MRVQLIVSFKHLKENKELKITANNDFFNKKKSSGFIPVDFSLCGIHVGICSKKFCKIYIYMTV